MVLYEQVVVFHPSKKDLHEIHAYIVNELQNTSAAMDVLANITKRSRSLTGFPFIGAPLASVVEVETDYRFIVCGNYTVFYRYDNETIYVIRVLYSRRDFAKILFGQKQEDDE